MSINEEVICYISVFMGSPIYTKTNRWVEFLTQTVDKVVLEGGSVEEIKPKVLKQMQEASIVSKNVLDLIEENDTSKK